MDQKKVKQRDRRSNRSQCGESPNVTDAPDHRCTAERAQDDPTPKACSDNSYFGWREALGASPDAQQRALQSIAYLHEGEA
jgi:hypothetical protein